MRHAALLFATLALAACSGNGGSTDPVESNSPPAAAEIGAQPVAAPDGPVKLSALSDEAASLLGRIALECRFGFQGRTILITGATGPDTGKGIAVANGSQLALVGKTSTFDNDVVLASDDYTFSIRMLTGERQSAAGRTEWPAELVVAGPHGKSTYSPGTWSCAK